MWAQHRQAAFHVPGDHQTAVGTAAVHTRVSAAAQLRQRRHHGITIEALQILDVVLQVIGHLAGDALAQFERGVRVLFFRDGIELQFRIEAQCSHGQRRVRIRRQRHDRTHRRIEPLRGKFFEGIFCEPVRL